MIISYSPISCIGVGHVETIFSNNRHRSQIFWLNHAATDRRTEASTAIIEKKNPTTTARPRHARLGCVGHAAHYSTESEDGIMGGRLRCSGLNGDGGWRGRGCPVRRRPGEELGGERPRQSRVAVVGGRPPGAAPRGAGTRRRSVPSPARPPGAGWSSTVEVFWTSLLIKSTCQNYQTVKRQKADWMAWRLKKIQPWGTCDHINFLIAREQI